MRFSCTQENLSQALQVVSHIASKNSALPILKNVLLRADNKELRLITTNLEMAVTCRVRAKVEEDGDYTVPSSLFNEYLAIASKGKVDVDAKEVGLAIETADNDKTLIKGAAASDFPLIPQISKEVVCGLLVDDFKKMVQQVLFAASRNEARPELCGILINFNPEDKDGYAVFAATDSYRLAEKQVKLMVGERYSKSNRRVIVPARALQEVMRIVSVYHEDIEDNPPLEMSITDNQILFSYGPVEIISRLVEGQYPDYRQIIPTNFKTVVSFNTAELIKRIKAASLFSNLGINGVDLKIFGGNDQKIVLTSMNGQLGDHVSEILCNIDGENNNSLLNFRYLLDGLANLTDEYGFLKITSPESPCVIQPKNNSNYLYIVMPIRQ